MINFPVKGYGFSADVKTIKRIVKLCLASVTCL